MQEVLMLDSGTGTQSRKHANCIATRRISIDHFVLYHAAQPLVLSVTVGGEATVGSGNGRLPFWAR